MKDTVAIFGDVHGESKQLARLIEKIHAVNPDMELYSVGDLIDRGPDSSGVIDLCIKHNIKGQLGNHELWLADLVKKKVFDTFCLSVIMGGTKTIESYGVVVTFERELEPYKIAKELLEKIPESHKEYIKNLPEYRCIEVDGHKYWLIHSGLSEAAALNVFQMKLRNKFATDLDMMNFIVKEGSEGYFMWPTPVLPKDNSPVHNLYKFKSGTQVLGHRPVKVPIVTNDLIALDTGCGTCDPKTLSAILLPSKEVIKVDESWI